MKLDLRIAGKGEARKMIKATLYLSSAYPITIEAKDRQELIQIIAEYDRRNLIVMLAQAIEQLSI